MPIELLLFGAGIIGGALNSVAGGGSFIVFPAMLHAGITPVAANATTTVGLWPASVASAVGYRREMPQDRRLLYWLIAASLVGGGLGAELLLLTSDITFMKLIPFLIGFAALVLTFGPQLQRMLVAGFGEKIHSLALGTFIQFLISIYGGYFGGGMGILMLATYSVVMGMTNIHSMNGLKNILGAALNGVAIILFVAKGETRMGPAFACAIGGILGGYAGAAIARRIAPNRVRTVIVVFAWMMTVYFAWGAFFSNKR